MNDSNSLPKIPTVTSWRKKPSRKRFFEQLGEKLCSLFVYEMAGQEILSIRRDELQFPDDHLSLLKQSYLKAFYPKQEEKKNLLETVGSWFGLKDDENKHIKELIDYPYFELPSETPESEPEQSEMGGYEAITQLPQPVNYYRCIAQAASCGLMMAKRRRDKLKARNRFDHEYHASAVSAKGFYFCDWEQQVKTLASLDAIEREFGGPTAIEELAVCNDWLMDRMMNPLAFVQVFSET